MPNHLADSTSPYLLQHQHNPVDWYPWGPEALEKSVRESKPIFLSIGYAACHWCHVMEHESFENPTLAAILNEHFICIKVDREQRPDLDHIYMQTVQMLTGSGGWPMSVFLTPERKPFYGGTYWPPTRRRGLPGFDDVLRAVINAWQNNPQGVASQSHEITQHLQSAGKPQNPELADLEEALLWNADQWLAEVFDEKWGGFGGAPKFPHAMDLRLLMQLQSRRPDEQRFHRIVRTLDGMADGGIYDHLGGGFARYSTDEQWLVPHFEKMLYDNALLSNAYLDGYLLTGSLRYRQVVCQTLEYVLQDLTDRLGGFYCTRDADSEGEEGKFYVWSREEVLDVLGTDQGNVFCEAYGVTFGGNFEGKSILHRPEPFEQVAKRLGLSDAELESQLQHARGVLLEVRNKRVWPGLDDKVLCSWNALMIISLARAGAAFSNPSFMEAAENAAAFIEQHMTLTDGRLLHSWRQGRAEIPGFLEDYAYLAEALIALFECTGKVEYVQRAIQLVGTLDTHFRDAAGGFFFTASDSESLIARYKDQHDGSVPSGNAMAATALVRLSLLTGDERWQELAEGTLRQAAPFMKKSPGGAGQMLIALDHYLGPSSELVYVAPDRATVNTAIAHAFSAFRGRAIIVPTYVTEGAGNSLDASTLKELVRGRMALQSQLTLYECSQGTCKPPVVIESL